MADDCRRCLECVGQLHHWSLEYAQYRDDSGEPLSTYGCKHCDALGEPCSRCGADPEFDEAPRDPDCPACAGSGIEARA